MIIWNHRILMIRTNDFYGSQQTEEIPVCGIFTSRIQGFYFSVKFLFYAF